jgi:hypothetical protein
MHNTPPPLNHPYQQEVPVFKKFPLIDHALLIHLLQGGLDGGHLLPLSLPFPLQVTSGFGLTTPQQILLDPQRVPHILQIPLHPGIEGICILDEDLEFGQGFG